MPAAISVVLPTFNNERTLDACLSSLGRQRYDGTIEIICIDGGSTDRTIDIIRSFGLRELANPSRTEELGRPIGIRAASGEYVLFVDADNVLPGDDWLARLVEPLVRDAELALAEPIRYCAERSDPLMSRYVAMLGGDDPVAVAFDLLDRESAFREWRKAGSIATKATPYGYEVRVTSADRIPPLGANGCLIRRSFLVSVRFDPFVHTDVIFRLVEAGHASYAKVNVGIKHLHADTLGEFLAKKDRRARRMFSRSGRLHRDYSPDRTPLHIALQALRILAVYPLLWDAGRATVRGYGTTALIHPFVTIATAGIYARRALLAFVDR